MKISEHSIISNEWLDSEILRLTSLYSEDTHRIGSKIEALLEVKKQLLSPMPLCENIFNACVQYGAECMTEKPDLDIPNMPTFLNSDIQLKQD